MGYLVILVLIAMMVLPRAGASYENEPYPPFPLDGDFRDLNKQLDDFASLRTRHYGAQGELEIPADADGDEVYLWFHTAILKERAFDPDLGRYSLESAQVREIRRKKDSLISDFVYTFDPYGRRFTWDPPGKPQNPDQFLILMGCSFVFGEGVQDKETLSYYLSDLMPYHATYNYGYTGSAPNIYLAVIQSQRLKKEIPQKKGAMVYVSLAEGHVTRSSGYLDALKWLKDSPYYEMEDGRLKRKGSFLTGRPVLTQLLLFFEKIKAYIGLDPNQDFPRLTKSNHDYYCQLVKEMKSEFQRQYPESLFLVYLHPFQSGEMTQWDKDCFNKNKIAYVQGSQELNKPEYKIPNDGHPNALGNRVVAADIKRWIEALPQMEMASYN